MQASFRLCSFIAVIFAAVSAQAGVDAPGPYSGEQRRAIKALSPAEIEALQAGEGMGFAKAAELNGYPGPLHVLQLAAELGLSEKQGTLTRKLFDRMSAAAKTLGSELIEEERRLDELFASERVTPKILSQALDRIASLQARLRAVHLEAHLEQRRILRPSQNLLYAELRGYGESNPHHGSEHAH